MEIEPQDNFKKRKKYIAGRCERGDGKSSSWIHSLKNQIQFSKQTEVESIRGSINVDVTEK